MDIIVGESAGIGPSDHYTREEDGTLLMEARFLEIKEKKEQGESGKPARGRVLSLLIPDGQKIPRGLETGDYRIYLRFVHRRQERF